MAVCEDPVLATERDVAGIIVPPPNFMAYTAIILIW
jgi:hypothetical protein